MPLEPVKCGIKVWARADASNGYISAFQVYTKKSGDTTEHGLGERVVKDLTVDLKDTHTACTFTLIITFLVLIFCSTCFKMFCMHVEHCEPTGTGICQIVCGCGFRSKNVRVTSALSCPYFSKILATPLGFLAS